MKSRIHRRHFIAALRLGAVLLFSHSYSSGASSPGPMTVRILAPAPIACLGQSVLPLEVVLTNNSGESLDVNAKSIGGFYLQKYKDGKEINSENGIDDAIFENWVRIPPHQTVISPLSWEIGPKGDFGGASGTYSIQLSFYIGKRKPGGRHKSLGSVLTNKIVFIVSDCSVKSAGERPLAGGTP